MVFAYYLNLYLLYAALLSVRNVLAVRLKWFVFAFYHKYRHNSAIGKVNDFYCIKKRRILEILLFVPRPGIEPGWVAPLVFETSASTDSAIWAILFRNCDAKVMLFVYYAKKNAIFLKKSFIYLPISLKKSNFAGRLLSARPAGSRYLRSLSLLWYAI